MDISSEVSMYCESQNPCVRFVIPEMRRHHRGLLLIRNGEQQNYQYPPNSGLIPCHLNNNQLMQPSFGPSCSNLHGNVKDLDKTNSTDDKNNPIDLSSTSNLKTISNSSKTDDDSDIEKLKSPKKEPKSPVIDAEKFAGKIEKRKLSIYIKNQEALNDHKRNIDSWVGHVKPVPGIPRQAGSKREEVLKAARSLFSKRTRTLYHWLYPSTSKNKLKSTVAAAWDTLSTAEKDFYISQVLGRFGVPACSLMVNPQLGGLKSASKINAASLPTGANSQVDETRRAVSNLLMTEDDVAWSSYSHASQNENDLPPRKRRRNQNYKNGESSGRDSNRQRQNTDEEETLILKQIRDASLDEDFADDPELSTEFEQFRWALHVTNTQEQK